MPKLDLKDLTVLIMPPCALSINTLNLIERCFTVVKQSVLNTSELVLDSEKPFLALVNNVTDDIVKATSKFRLKLYVYQLTEESKNELSKRLYLSPKEFYQGVGELNLKDEISKIEKNGKIIKAIGHPSRIMVDEATLKKNLKLDEPIVMEV